MEVNYLNMIVVLYISILLSTLICKFKIKRWTILYLIITCYLLLYFCYPIMLFVCVFIYTKMNWKQTLCIMMNYYCFCVLESNVIPSIFDGYIIYIYEQCHIFVPLCIVVILLSIFDIFFSVNYCFFYYHSTKVKIGNVEFVGIGYMDSGNSMQYNQIPVIYCNTYVDEKLLDDVPKERIRIRSVVGEKEEQVYLAKILYEGVWKKVYVAFQNATNSYDFLLNVRLGE